MKFKVSGIDREHGSRMVLQLDATNRAMAERKATQSGMREILHCEQVADPNSLQVERTTHRGEFEPPSRGGKIAMLMFVIIAIAALGYWAWRSSS